MPEGQNRDPGWKRGNSVRGRGRARGGGRGRNNGAKKRSSEEAGLGDEVDRDADEDLKDMTESPLEGKGDEAGTDQPQTSVIRKLNMDEQSASESSRGVAVDASMQGAMIVPPPPPSYVTPRDRKKHKNGNSPNKSNLDSVAGSSEERRRVQ